MNDLDEKIRAALNAEDAELLGQYESDAPLHEMVVELYRGRRRWINLIASMGTFILFATQLWCGYQFFGAETTQAMIAWATGFLALFIWLVLMKLWFWLELVRNSVTREVKRLELQVALLNRTMEQ